MSEVTVGIALFDENGHLRFPPGTEARVSDHAGGDNWMIEVRVEDERLSSGARYEFFVVEGDKLEPRPQQEDMAAQQF